MKSYKTYTSLHNTCGLELDDNINPKNKSVKSVNQINEQYASRA